MDQQELLKKIAQIEEQATYTLAEFPRMLSKERLRMIVALARYIRTELSFTNSAGALADHLARPSVNDNGKEIRRA